MKCDYKEEDRVYTASLMVTRHRWPQCAGHPSKTQPALSTADHAVSGSGWFSATSVCAVVSRLLRSQVMPGEIHMKQTWHGDMAKARERIEALNRVLGAFDSYFALLVHFSRQIFSFLKSFENFAIFCAAITNSFLEYSSEWCVFFKSKVAFNLIF